MVPHQPELCIHKNLCSSLNVTGPHKFIGRRTIRRCGLVGVDGALAEEVYHSGGGL